MFCDVDSLCIFSSILVLPRIFIIAFNLRIQTVLVSLGKSDCVASKNRDEYLKKLGSRNMARANCNLYVNQQAIYNLTFRTYDGKHTSVHWIKITLCTKKIRKLKKEYLSGPVGRWQLSQRLSSSLDIPPGPHWNCPQTVNKDDNMYQLEHWQCGVPWSAGRSLEKQEIKICLERKGKWLAFLKGTVA